MILKPYRDHPLLDNGGYDVHIAVVLYFARFATTAAATTAAAVAAATNIYQGALVVSIATQSGVIL